MYAKGDNLPVVTDVNLINPIGTLGRRPADLQHRGQRDDALDPRFNHINRCSRSANRPSRSMTLQASKRLAAGPDLQRPVHARQGPRQHAAADAADGAGGTGPLGSEQPRSRPGAEPARHAPQLHRQHRLHVAATRRTTRSCAALLERQPDRRAAAVQQRPAGQPAGEPRPERRRRRERSAAGRRPQLALPADPQERRLALHALDPDPRIDCAPK